MKKLLFFSSLALTLCATSVIAQTNATTALPTYGAAFSKQDSYSPARLPFLMQQKQSLDNVKLVGYITEVCQKEGCWIRLSAEKNKGAYTEVLVKMKDHAFSVPKDITGKMAIANGKLVKKTQSVAEQQHYLEDTGASKEEIAAIKAPKDIYELQATGIAMYQ